MNFDFSPLIAKQRELDSEIALLHHVDYASTFTRRFLALYVELGELANATRCFKYWSNKGPEAGETILEEYADGLHFLLSLGVMLDISECAYEGPELRPYDDLTSGFLNVYQVYGELEKDFVKDNWIKAMEAYVRLLLTMGFAVDIAIDAYYAKLQINKKRQEEGY